MLVEINSSTSFDNRLPVMYIHTFIHIVNYHILLE
jgi:hypothetical protein